MTRLDVDDLGTVLGIWAHPDDEAFLSGGLMATATDAGRHVACITATRGERGAADTVAWPPGRLGRTREYELQASLAVLGVHEHHCLGLQDGTCADADESLQVGRIAEIVARVDPDTIITFGPDGFTGHADHQAVSRWAMAARRAAAPTARVLHPTTTAAFADRWHDLHAHEHVFLVPDLPLRTRPEDLALELHLDDDVADRKLVALRAQATQTTQLVARVGEDAFRSWWSTETFIDAARTPPRTWSSWSPSAAAI